MNDEALDIIKSIRDQALMLDNKLDDLAGYTKDHLNRLAHSIAKSAGDLTEMAERIYDFMDNED